MNITKRHIPFLISAASLFAYMLSTGFILWNLNISLLNIFSDYGVIISFLFLMIIAFTTLLKSNTWIYLYFVFLIISLIPAARIAGLINITIYFILPINITSLVLLYFHIKLNDDVLQVKGPSQEDVDRKAEQKRSIYRTNFEKKSLEELKNIDLTQLTIEARVVLMDLIDEREAKS